MTEQVVLGRTFDLSICVPGLLPVISTEVVETAPLSLIPVEGIVDCRVGDM